MAEEALNKQISDLKVQRGVIKGQQTKLKTYVDEKAPAANIFELGTKLGMLETYFTNFNAIQSRLECTDNTEVLSTERDKFEENYFQIKSALLGFINNKKPRNSVTVDNTTLESISVQPKTVDNIEKLKLPIFSGELIDWLDFWSVFQVLVHNNEKYTEEEKFQHLRNCLAGNAKHIIKGMNTTAKNYDEAIKLLKTRYDNKRYVFQAHISSIFELQNITKPSAESLRLLLDKMKAHLRSLLTIGKKEQIADGLLLHILISKLDFTTQAKWEEEIANQGHRSTDSTLIYPTWEEFIIFLEKRLQTLKFLQGSKGESHSAPSASKSSCSQFKSRQKFGGQSSTSFVASLPSTTSCVFCLQPEHSPFRCQKFQGMSPTSRFNEVKRMMLCINCLKGGHSVRSCKSINKCQKCSGNHHTLLHINPASSAQSHEVNESSSSSAQVHSLAENQSLEANPHNSIAMVMSNSSGKYDNNITYSLKTTVLPTALIYALDANNKYVTCRALLDSASQSNFISENFAQRLGLTRKPASSSISGIGDVSTQVKHETAITIKSRENNFISNIIAFILPSITGKQPGYRISVDDFTIPANIKLADPSFHEPKPIDVLIGAELFFSLLCVGQIKLKPELPILQKTVFGWIVSGNIIEPIQHTLYTKADQTPYDDNLATLLKSFWEVENVLLPIHTYSSEELACAENFDKTTERSTSGQYVVRLPLRQDPAILGESYSTALKRLQSMERKLMSNPALKTDYIKFLDEYEELHHMEELPKTQCINSLYFLPHHCVVKNDATSTRVRVVFDGSCPTRGNLHKSLNDILMKGPTVQDDLFSIILRFRLHRFVITADIVKMYRQVLVHPDDRWLQCILWRKSPADEIKVYQLRTVTYGTSPAAYLATRSLNQCAHDGASKFPHAAERVLRDFYVDNLMTGADTKEELQLIKREISEMLASCHFPLKKWCSNLPEILKDVPDQDKEKHFQLDNNHFIKALGLIWDPTMDYFAFYSNTQHHTKVNKRLVLSEIARFFDPLGLINPIVVSAKIFMQFLWKLQLSWDESLPQELQTQWCQFRLQLNEISKIKFPRYVALPNSEVQLHGFADAISLPRLELCAALLLAELLQKTRATLKTPGIESFCWTDSSIALGWIRSPSFQWETFVSNRVSKIQQLTEGSSWNHIPTHLNPADLVSRGALPNDLQLSTLWFHGPQFLMSSYSSWPKQPGNLTLNLPEMKKHLHVLQTMR